MITVRKKERREHKAASGTSREICTVVDESNQGREEICTTVRKRGEGGVQSHHQSDHISPITTHDYSATRTIINPPRCYGRRG